METFRCDNKLIRFRSGFVFKLKKSPKRSDSIFKKFWNRLKRSAFVPIKSGRNQNVLVCFDSKLRYRNVCAFVTIISFLNVSKKTRRVDYEYLREFEAKTPENPPHCHVPLKSALLQKIL
jgi:hypothetical protein